MNATRIAIVAAALALPAAAFAYDKPPATSNPPGTSSSGGSNTGSSGGSPASIPEPAAIGLFALGIAGAALMRRRARRNRAD